MSDLVKFEDLSLEALSEVAKEAFEECNWALERALDKATKFGRILLIVRRKVQHGEWTDWCEQTFGDAISLRKIQRYMQIANASDQTLLEGASTIDEALGMITEKRIPEPQTPGQQSVQSEPETPEKPVRESAPRTSREPSGRPQAAPFHLGERLQDDRESIMGMAGDYAEHRKLKEFCDMLTKCVQALRGEA